MKSRLFLSLSLSLTVALVSACKKPAPPPDPDPQPQPVPQPVLTAPTVATTPAPVIILLDAAPPNAQTAPAIAIVQRLGRATTADELTPLYAPKVIVNGTTVAAPDHIKKKLAALGEFKESYGAIDADTTVDGKDVYARFTKKLLDEKGETAKEMPMLVVVRDGVIVEENEEPVDWCKNKDKTVNTKMLPGFKLSAASAVAAVKDSKHFAELKKAVPTIGTDLFGFACAKRCAGPKRECGYHFRVSDMSTDNSNQVVNWVYVDPVTKLLWWQEKDWQSEQLR